MLIRKFKNSDAEQISDLIKANYTGILSKYYSQEIVDFFVRKNSPQSVIDRSKDRDIFVSLEGDVITGIAALKDCDVKTVFVHPKYQGKRIASHLMFEIEKTAIQRGIKKLVADSSLAAVKFYEKLGYKKIRKIVSTLEGVNFEEIHMEKEIQ